MLAKRHGLLVISDALLILWCCYEALMLEPVLTTSIVGSSAEALLTTNMYATGLLACAFGGTGHLALVYRHHRETAVQPRSLRYWVFHHEKSLVLLEALPIVCVVAAAASILAFSGIIPSSLYVPSVLVATVFAAAYALLGIYYVIKATRRGGFDYELKEGTW